MFSQAQSRGQVLDGITKHGVAPGGRKMIDLEAAAAQVANETGIYACWRSSKGGDCTRVGPGAKCFCGHKFEEHSFLSKKSLYPRCNGCNCQQFAFIPQRPEEVGDWWLPRRKGFNVHTWRAKCRCGHGHDEHDPTSRRCKCGCSMFQSNFACVVCDLKWEDHETVFETTQERIAAGRSVGAAFEPLSNDREIQQLVFPAEGVGASQGRLSSYAPSRVRPAQVEQQFAEKSVQIMHESSGGVIKGQGTANRWGKVENPPEEWLYKPPGTKKAVGSTTARQALGGQLATGRAAATPSSIAGVGQARPHSSAGRVPVAATSRQLQQAPQQPPNLASGFRPVYD